MSTIARIAEMEDSLIALLRLSLGATVKNIATLSAEDVQDGDTIVTDTPALRVFFSDEELKTEELKAVLYDSVQTFVVLCGAQDLRSRDNERKGAYELVTGVCDALAGARPTLPSHTQKPLVKPVNVKLLQSNENGTWYAVRVAVEHFHLFSGQNA